MKIPDVIKNATKYKVEFIGKYKGNDVYAEIPEGEDNGAGTGYPFVFLYNEGNVTEECVAIDQNLCNLYFDWAKKYNPDN